MTLPVFGFILVICLILKNGCGKTASRTHNKRYAATSPRLTFKNFKLSDFLKFSDFKEAPTNSLTMIY